MPKRRGYRVKRRTHKEGESEANPNDRKSFVVKRGAVGKNVVQLIQNMRQVMLPFSAKSLKEGKHTKLKDLVSVASIFGVTHIQMFSQKDSGVYWRIGGIPAGPTLLFQVHNYSLMSDIRSSQKKPRSNTQDYQHSPLVVLNGFRKKVQGKDQAGIQIAATVLTNMFQAVDVENIKVNVCRRVVLFNRATEDKNLIEMRHYAIVSNPAGVSRTIKKLLTQNPNKVPKLGEKMDIHDYVVNGNVSESEMEDAQEVTAYNVPGGKRERNEGRGRVEKLALSLVELGPRMTLELKQIQTDLCAGDILYQSGDYVKPEGVKKEKKKEEKGESETEESGEESGDESEMEVVSRDYQKEESEEDEDEEEEEESDDE